MLNYKKLPNYEDAIDAKLQKLVITFDHATIRPTTIIIIDENKDKDKNNDTPPRVIHSFLWMSRKNSKLCSTIAIRFIHSTFPLARMGKTKTTARDIEYIKKNKTNF